MVEKGDTVFTVGAAAVVTMGGSLTTARRVVDAVRGVDVVVKGLNAAVVATNADKRASRIIMVGLSVT